MTRLEYLIRREIAREGAISFARFMEMALYSAELGYYRRDRDVFGIHGDFHTAAQLQPVFGELLAHFTGKMAAAFSPANRFEVLEIGSGRGDLRDALRPWNYRGFDWTGDPWPSEINGLIVANEFFDALPVHLLHKESNSWRELCVDIEGDELTFSAHDIRSAQLLDYAARYGDLLPEHGLLEVSLEAAKWMKRISDVLQHGCLLVIDYGYSAKELLRFPAGTLISYRKHAATPALLERPGEQDLSAHVNFTYLQALATEYGLQAGTELSLRDWALQLWDEQELTTRWARGDARWRLQWKQLVVGMGGTFRVLIFKK